MSKTVVLLLVLEFLIASCLVLANPVSGDAEDENSWVSKAPMGWARGCLGVATVNGKIYAIGGDEGHLMDMFWNPLFITHDVVDTNEEYNPILDKWVWKSPMPTARARFGTAVYQNKIYCIGGYNTGLAEVGVNEVYDPATNTWEVRASLPTPRSAPATNVVDGKIYAIGGLSTETHSTLNVVEVYDPETDTWTTKTPPPLEVKGSASAVVDDKIFVLGEELIDPVLYRVGYRIQVYDPADDSWSIRSPAKANFWGSAVATSGLNAYKRVYFFDENWTTVYDPSSDSWSDGASSPTPRPLAGAVAIDDLIYVVGGRMRDEQTGDWGYIVDMKPTTANEQYMPLGYGTIPPDISIISPENANYTSNNVTLAFAVNKKVEWMGYSLDGQENVTITGNTTLAELSNGLHNITVYAKDSFENSGASKAISFSVDVPDSFLNLVITAVASVAAVGVVGLGLVVYFKKRKH
jgi:N-acetylneuraminic acid mutarotase